jgi:hypothetical protein
MNRHELLDNLEHSIRSLSGDKAARDRALALVKELREVPLDAGEWWATYGPTRKQFSAQARQLVECILAGMSDARVIADALGIDVDDLPRYVHRVAEQIETKRAAFTITLSRGTVSTHEPVILRGPKFGR